MKQGWMEGEVELRAITKKASAGLTGTLELGCPFRRVWHQGRRESTNALVRSIQCLAFYNYQTRLGIRCQI